LAENPARIWVALLFGNRLWIDIRLAK